MAMDGSGGRKILQEAEQRASTSATCVCAAKKTSMAGALPSANSYHGPVMTTGLAGLRA
jgi:hypothetical protein